MGNNSTKNLPIEYTDRAYMPVEQIIEYYRKRNQLSDMMNNWRIWSYLAIRDFGLTVNSFETNNPYPNTTPYERYFYFKSLMDRHEEFIRAVYNRETPYGMIENLPATDVFALYSMNKRLGYMVDDWNLWSFLAERDFNFPRDAFLNNNSKINAFQRYMILEERSLR